jgi:hypothetical protein
MPDNYLQIENKTADPLAEGQVKQTSADLVQIDAVMKSFGYKIALAGGTESTTLRAISSGVAVSPFSS